MNTFFVYLLIGVTSGAVYALAASGLVVTYATSRIFNFAHGAIGMCMAFLAYTLWVDQGLPEWLALGLCVFVVAPAIGVLLDFAVMRHLERASVAVRLVVTLTIFIFLQGLAVWIWGTELRSMPQIFGNGSFAIGDLTVTNDQAATVLIAVVVAAGMWFLFKRTTVGTIMRGVVDDRDLTQLHGVNPRYVTSLSWALGCSLAALAAILVAPGLSMSIEALSLLVVSAYAAAIIGGLTSVPLTFLGALALGIVTALLVGYLPPENELVQDVAPAMPFVLLFVALVVRREELGVFQRVEVFNEPRPPALRTTIAIGVAGVVVVALVAPQLSSFHALVAGTGLVWAGILLSLVLIAGMAGQVSLAQLAFVGVGGVMMSHIGDDMPYWLALLASAASAAVVGALIALPALRLRGLYLALSTLAFAVLMDKVVFVNSHVFPTSGGAIPVRAPQIFGLRADSFNSMLPLLAAVVALYAIGILAIRRGRFGRRLTAMRDAPAAASALGMNLVSTKLVVFTTSAAMAGLIGALFGGLNDQVIASQFGYMQSLIALLILVIYGLTSVPGAILGSVFYAIFFMMLPEWVEDPDTVNLIQPLAIGLAMFGLAQHPEGVVNQVRDAIKARRGGGAGPPRSSAQIDTATQKESHAVARG
ncbi:ABC transporter permease [Conexibacter sp. CPCC 206217]|uniref:ABC transporter permease n=1 Tax=Conexibacter sp. CPCC 206217 TaxID=3064574 RepID=UPI00271AAF64|nr:ABC transporter permease [Conexibacter sp. CPCC 206217]MDO8212010.1 ABC transporter permease [Conexibacter sp. CPCC 206217]